MPAHGRFPRSTLFAQSGGWQTRRSPRRSTLGPDREGEQPANTRRSERGSIPGIRTWLRVGRLILNRRTSSTGASPSRHYLHRSLACDAGRARACSRPPACPRAAISALAPARKGHHKRAEQSVAADSPRLTRRTGPTKIGLTRSKCLSQGDSHAGKSPPYR